MNDKPDMHHGVMKLHNHAIIHDNTYLATAPLPSIQYNQKLVIYNNYIVQLFVLHHKNLKKLLKRTFKDITDFFAYK